MTKMPERSFMLVGWMVIALLSFSRSSPKYRWLVGFWYIFTCKITMEKIPSHNIPLLT